MRANDFGHHGQVGGMDPKLGVVSEKGGETVLVSHD
ncbi:Uncharacterized protein LW94_10766 [Fusarium fujikuroi]|nr:Uncharacterized protein LW93_13265 [Fusarium fujikuroi]KLP12382.1 Uncharacterized protein Y057_8030 [Fusarium fujikuroi]KLP13587.1 Uncharacterized protein LW94_10766 [Fusarium fujikuroi]